MAKKNEQPESDTALMTRGDESLPSHLAGAFGGAERAIVKGLDNDSGVNLSRVTIYQGTPEEVEMYGEGHKRGDWLDTLEVRSLGPVIRIVPVSFVARFALWQKGQRNPVATWDNERDVPPELKEWTTGEGDNRVPPQAKKSINCVVCVEGEKWPYALTFKSTGLKAFESRILPLEARRAATGQPPGLYELGSIDDKNSEGKPYKRITAKYIGTPSVELLELAAKVYQSATKFQKQAADMESPAE